MANFSESSTAYVVLINNTIHSITADRTIADQISTTVRNSVVQSFPIISEYQPQVAVTESSDVTTFGEFISAVDKQNPPEVPSIKNIFDKKTAAKKKQSGDGSLKADIKIDATTHAPYVDSTSHDPV